MTETKKTMKQVLRGTVVSNKMDKTIVVLIVTRVPQPKYGKVVERSKKFHAHDEQNACGMGDIVTITTSRPLSKTKTWVLVDIIEKARQE